MLLWIHNFHNCVSVEMAEVDPIRLEIVRINSTFCDRSHSSKHIPLYLLSIFVPITYLKKYVMFVHTTWCRMGILPFQYYIKQVAGWEKLAVNSSEPKRIVLATNWKSFFILAIPEMKNPLRWTSVANKIVTVMYMSNWKLDYSTLASPPFIF